jgi:hypothetical protein
MPFIRTPINIVKFAAQRSPFAPLFKEVRENLKGVNGVAERDAQIARIAMGSTVGVVTASYAADGTITGGGPADPKQRAALYADWLKHGRKAIERLREERPHIYVMTIASIVSDAED